MTTFHTRVIKIITFLVPGPVWELVEPEERDGVGVDGDGDGENADDVHDHARLHHVNGLERAMAEDDGVGGCRHRQGEGVRANNPWEKKIYIF